MAAYVYAARLFFGARWPEWEAVIKTNPEWAQAYSVHIINQRWPEAEEYIKTDSFWWKKYKEHFKIESKLKVWLRKALTRKES